MTRLVISSCMSSKTRPARLLNTELHRKRAGEHQAVGVGMRLYFEDMADDQLLPLPDQVGPGQVLLHQRGGGGHLLGPGSHAPHVGVFQLKVDGQQRSLGGVGDGCVLG